MEGGKQSFGRLTSGVKGGGQKGDLKHETEANTKAYTEVIIL